MGSEMCIRDRCLGFFSAGFGAGFVSNCVDNFDSFSSSSAILASRSFFVLVLLVVDLRVVAILFINYA